MLDLDLYASGLVVSLGIALAAWAISNPRRDVSVVDSVWPLMVLAMAVTYVTLAPVSTARAMIVLFVVTVWATRLSVFVTLRNRGRPEDRRYRTLRETHEPGFWLKSLYMVFALQAILAWIISLPLLGAIHGATPLNWIDYAATTTWLLGFGLQAISDQQLATFNARPENRTRVLDRGLWRYTRHPNLFGEACIWWGFYLFAVAAGAWWSIVAPALITVLLLRVGGIALIERDIGERRPSYRAYKQRTNAFFPGPTRQPAHGPD
jgi:steroid 5-alpha reductase family enzyme